MKHVLFAVAGLALLAWMFRNPDTEKLVLGLDEVKSRLSKFYDVVWQDHSDHDVRQSAAIPISLDILRLPTNNIPRSITVFYRDGKTLLHYDHEGGDSITRVNLEFTNGEQTVSDNDFTRAIIRASQGVSDA